MFSPGRPSYSWPMAYGGGRYHCGSIVRVAFEFSFHRVCKTRVFFKEFHIKEKEFITDLLPWLLVITTTCSLQDISLIHGLWPVKEFGPFVGVLCGLYAKLPFTGSTKQRYFHRTISNSSLMQLSLSIIMVSMWCGSVTVLTLYQSQPDDYVSILLGFLRRVGWCL